MCHEKLMGDECCPEKFVSPKISIGYTKVAPKCEAFVVLTLKRRNSGDLAQLVKGIGNEDLLG